MPFRTTTFSSSNQAIRFAAQFNANIQRLQRQISSGIQFDRPSEDPVTFRQITTLSVRLQELQTESSSITDSETRLNTSVSQLTRFQQLITRSRTLAQQGVQATSQDQRIALAVEVEGILVGLQEITSTRSANSFLYSGTRSDQEPYEFSDPLVEGSTLSVQYNGSDQNSLAFIGDAISIETLLSGEQVFGQSNRQETIFLGDTGAANGVGTDSLIGRATLQVRHTGTTYTGASGIAPGDQSVGGDTIITPLGENQIRVEDTSGNGTAGTIQFNGGDVVSFTQSDTNLRIVDENGSVLFVDTSSITPGFSGSIDFESTGTLSVDDGRSTVPIDFSDSQTVTDSTNGRQTHIDTRSLRSSGDEFLEFPGTSDAFQVLYELIEDLRNTRELGNLQRAESIDRRLGELGNIADSVLDVIGRQSATLQTLDELDFRVADLQLEVETQLNQLQATNIPETVLRLQNDQNLLEFTYAVTAQIASTSLLDFLR